MKPFAILLGINDNEFSPFKDLFFKNKDKVLLVEGKKDVKYFELLQNTIHGKNKLIEDLKIIPYDGSGNLKNQPLLKFFKDHYKNIFLTYDLDKEQDIITHINKAGFNKGSNALPIGLDKPSLRDIEGIVPERIRNQVISENPDIMSILASADNKDKDIRESKKNRLKDLIYDKFYEKIEYNDEYFKEFYKIAKSINKFFKEDNK